MSKVQIVWFKNLERWDVKNFLYSLKSNFPLVKLGKYIIENNTKIKPFESPETEFDILGVNNKEGVYFNETLLGSCIKQPYYQVRSGNIFYNPYRVNVGSIGIVPPEFDLKYTSPAYVVFKTNEMQLLSQYLVFVLKSTWFNVHLRANTKGSVRQNLSFEALCNLQIPLPPLEIQQEIVNKIQNIKDKIKALQEEEKRLKEEIEAYIYIALGLERKEQREKQKRFVVRFKDLERWDITFNQKNAIPFACHTEATAEVSLNAESQIDSKNKDTSLVSQSQYDKIESRNDNKPKYPLVKLGDICETNIGLTYKPSNISKNQKGIAVLRSNNIQNGQINYSDLIYVDNINIPKNKMAEKGDLLVCVRNGSLSLIGKTAMIEQNGMSFGAFMAIIRSKYNIFIYYILQTDFFKKTIFEHRTSGINQISQNDIKNFKIPLPPLEIQQEIINFIESKRAIMKANQSTIQSLQDAMDNELKKLIIT
ncbi:restriction endonuclease subunit S [uncultured Helicobacter sp.]|uniref:restriction endonuclease subunit S n=1 Tax=uncultured Helicobacter sp. TaxID=175537 RepID=UPI0025E86732|nr:restriction endonuclease subunit S [uncultured Helicobacter sp.]